MLTAVIERHGSLIRFNDAFLDFLTRFSIIPVACNVNAPHEKGKIENSIKYLRNNFWPLRSFTDLADIRTQVKKWLHTVANVRTHQSTGECPIDRFKKVKLNPLPELLPGVVKIAHNMDLKNIPYLFLPVCLVSGVRCQVSGAKVQNK